MKKEIKNNFYDKNIWSIPELKTIKLFNTNEGGFEGGDLENQGDTSI